MAFLRPPSTAEIMEQRRISPRIIRSGTAEPLSTYSENIPFVPAYDLLEAESARLSEAEAACVALALYHLVPDAQQSMSFWQINARREAIYKD